MLGIRGKWTPNVSNRGADFFRRGIRKDFPEKSIIELSSGGEWELM